MIRTAVPSPSELRTASIQQLFVASGALLEGHFLLKSGRHSARYLEKFAVLQHPSLAVEIGGRLAGVLAVHEPNVVVGPTTGGVLLAFEVARQLEGTLGRPVRGIFAEPAARGRRELRRGFAISAHDRLVLVDDILTTGVSLRETIDAVRAAGGRPLAAAVIADRSTEPIDLGIPLNALARLTIPTYPPADCALCAAGAPLTKPGTGAPPLAV